MPNYALKKDTNKGDYTPSSKLPELAEGINQDHKIAKEYAQNAIQRALSCGEKLAMAKAQCKHGEWIPWLEANTIVNERTARRYMKIYNGRSQLENGQVSDLTLRGALELLSEPKEKTPAPEQAMWDEFDTLYFEVQESARQSLAAINEALERHPDNAELKRRKKDIEEDFSGPDFSPRTDYENMTPVQFLYFKWLKHGVLITSTGIQCGLDGLSEDQYFDLGRDLAAAMAQEVSA